MKFITPDPMALHTHMDEYKATTDLGKTPIEHGEVDLEMWHVMKINLEDLS